jgi:phosphoesterase RecJ-like protein
MKSDLLKIVAALQGSASVAILSHINPEGDAIGSALGCHLTLKALGKEVATFNPDPVPKNLRGLPGAGGGGNRKSGDQYRPPHQQHSIWDV